MSDFRVRPGKSVAQELSRVLDVQLKHAQARLENWEEDPERAFHEVRRRLKKARAAARIARAVDAPLSHAINVLVRDAARELSGARDADVVLTVAARLAEDCPNRAVAAALKRFAAAARTDAGAQDREESAGEAASMVDDALRLSRRLDDVEAPPKTLKRAAQRAFHRADRAFVAAHRADGPRAVAEEVRHEWRKRVKDLWYVERLLADVWPIERRPRERLTNRLGKLLGAERDLLLLATRLRSSARACGGAAARDRALTYVQGERARIVAEAKALGARAHQAEPRVFRAAAAGAQRGARKTLARPTSRKKKASRKPAKKNRRR